ncbi:MAG: ethanolamine permease [Sandaracinaceae bacterium]|nr:ethanolamine permease [Sandaracinaceae bacterium]
MSAEQPRGVDYDRVEDGYFDKRGLRRYAGVWSLWALGVGAVISGNFFGWNFGLRAGGFGGMLIATAIITVMYAGLCFSIAEMAAALPHTGGAYSFARTAMGPWGGYVTGLAENMEYVLTPAVIVVGAGGYLGATFGTPAWAEPLWWLATYAIFVGLNVAGVETTFRFTVLITVAALAILAVFYAGAIPHFDLEEALRSERGRSWLPNGWLGVLGALPFAMWFYLAIEELPLAAEEAHDPVRDLPKGLRYGLLTLVALAIGTLVLNSGVAPGALAVGRSQEPLFLGLRTIFGDGLGARALALVAVTGLLASFHGIVFAYGRQIYSLSRAGYFPRALSITHAKRKTPWPALIAGGVVGFGVAFALRYSGTDSPVGAVLLNMAVFGAVLSYALQMLSYLLLRIKHPKLARPYRSPLGLAGAIVALVLSAGVLVTLFVVDPEYRLAAAGAAVWYVLGLVYFAVYARHHLVYSPEEKFAAEDAHARSPGP